jgi:hypothetical protein
MVDSRAKGARTETVVRDALKKHTGLAWERVPGYVPGRTNLWCVEVKGYAEDHVSSALLTGKSPQLIEFWKQSVRQGHQVNKKPLLIFKFDRSKIFTAFLDMPTSNYRYIFVSIDEHELYVALLEDWLVNEQPQFVT